MKLKAQIVLWILAIVFPAYLQGQHEKLIVGIEGGPSLNTINSNLKTLNKNNIIQFSYFAGSFQVNLSDYFAVVTCPSYESKGMKFEFTDISSPPSPVSYKTTIKLDYFDLPLIARAYIGKQVRGYFEIGTYMGYLHKAQLITEISGFPVVRDNILRELVRYNAGGVIGMGAQFQLTNFIISSGLRADFGIASLLKNTPVVTSFKTVTAKSFIGLAYRIANKKSKKPQESTLKTQ